MTTDLERVRHAAVEARRVEKMIRGAVRNVDRSAVQRISFAYHLTSMIACLETPARAVKLHWGVRFKRFGEAERPFAFCQMFHTGPHASVEITKQLGARWDITFMHREGFCRETGHAFLGMQEGDSVDLTVVLSSICAYFMIAYQRETQPRLLAHTA